MKEEPQKEDSDDQENSDVDVDHLETSEVTGIADDIADTVDTVIDLSSSGSCSWCHKHGPCALEDSGGTSSVSSSGSLNGITG